MNHCCVFARTKCEQAPNSLLASHNKPILYSVGVIKKELKKFKLPDEPGVYLFKRGPRILYIGKATSLRDRVRSYFATDLVSGRGSRIVGMVEEAQTLGWKKTGSVV